MPAVVGVAQQWFVDPSWELCCCSRPLLQLLGSSHSSFAACLVACAITVRHEDYSSERCWLHCRYECACCVCQQQQHNDAPSRPAHTGGTGGVRHRQACQPRPVTRFDATKPQVHVSGLNAAYAPCLNRRNTLRKNGEADHHHTDLAQVHRPCQRHILFQVTLVHL